MPGPDRDEERAVRERAYFIWEREGRPNGRAREHWERAALDGPGEDPGGEDGHMADEERILTGRPANFPALLTKDVLGG